ncbi:MAG: hypothetical protein KC656_09145, partial [Myxococcales bacterium]|nr:hypothetical protein [Myxococcales bacterium]
GRCRIPAPVPGTWEVATSVPADIRIAGLLAAPPTPPPPTPPPPPAPDQGDDMFSAQLIEGPGVFEGELTTADHDWFLLDLGGEVHVYTTGSTDTHGTALRGPDDVLVADDDSGSGNNFSLFVAEATAVWIDVRGFSPNTQGEYHLVVERVE